MDNDIGASFAQSGLAVVPSTLPADFHALARRRLDAHRWAGDDLPHHVPELRVVLLDQALSRVATSICGPEWVIINHFSMPEARPGWGRHPVHRDGLIFSHLYARVPCQTLLCFYTPHAMGEHGCTFFVPGSHHSPDAPETWAACPLTGACDEPHFVVTDLAGYHGRTDWPASLGGEPRTTVKFLIESLAPPPWHDAAMTLDLVRAERDADPIIRIMAVSLLGLCSGSRPPRALALAAESPCDETRLHAVRGLARHRPAHLRQAIARIAETDSNRFIRAYAAIALDRIDGRHPAVVRERALARHWPEFATQQPAEAA